MAGKGKGAKDSAMAAYLAKKGVKRTTTAAPCCHRSTGMGEAMLRHMMTCRHNSHQVRR